MRSLPVIYSNTLLRREEHFILVEESWYRYRPVDAGSESLQSHCNWPRHTT